MPQHAAVGSARTHATPSAPHAPCLPQDIAQKIEVHGDERLRMIKENEALRGQLENCLKRLDLEKVLSDKVEEQLHLQKRLLETQLAEATHVRAAEEARAKVLTVELDALREREKKLVKQLAGYSEKYDEFEKMIQDSNAARRAGRRRSPLSALRSPLRCALLLCRPVLVRPAPAICVSPTAWRCEGQYGPLLSSGPCRCMPSTAQRMTSSQRR